METILGIWNQNGNTITGTVDATLKASAVLGSEADQNYTHQAQVTIPANPGKSGLIVVHTYDTNWNEYYIGMYLDTANSNVTLEYVSRNEQGVETSRQVLAERTFPVTPATAYDLAVESKILSDGSFAVYGQVNGFTVVKAEDLAEPFGAGQRGFEVLAGQNATFTYDTFPAIPFFSPSFASFDEVTNRLGAQGPDANGNYTVYGLALSYATIQTQINRVNKYISNLVPNMPYPSNDPRVPFAELAAVDLSCMGILVVSVGGALIGAYDYSISDMGIQRSSPYASSIKVAVAGFKESAVNNLSNVTSPVAFANAQLGRNIPRQHYRWPDGY